MRTSEALSGYLVQLAADGRARHTTKQANRFIRKFIATMGDMPVEEIRHETLAAFLASPSVVTKAGGGARRPSSANALRSVLRSFFAFAHAGGYTPANPARLIRRARCAPRRPRGLSDAESDLLLAALASAKTVAEHRDRVLFVTMLKTGIRVGTAAALDVEDFDVAAGELRLRTLKGGGTDLVYVPRDVLELLRAHVGDRTTGPLFPRGDGGRLGSRQIARRLEMWTERARIRHLSPHGLRHAFAMKKYAETGDVLLVARLMCHRSVASTSVYASPSEHRMREAMAT